MGLRKAQIEMRYGFFFLTVKKKIVAWVVNSDPWYVYCWGEAWLLIIFRIRRKEEEEDAGEAFRYSC